MEKMEHTKSYRKAYRKDYAFEAVMVQARQKQVLEILTRKKPSKILEIGCGSELLCHKAIEAHLPFHTWVIVEPVKGFLKTARQLAQKERRLSVIPGFFEDSLPAIQDIDPGLLDFVVCSGMLNEIREPVKFLEGIKMILKPHGTLHVNVPNAGSLHRRLGQAMNLITRLEDKSTRNKSLMQYHNFDMPVLRSTLTGTGFSIIESGGYFLKPFTHQQMMAVRKILTQDVLNGLWHLGKDFPELATEIYVNAKIKK